MFTYIISTIIFLIFHRSHPRRRNNLQDESPAISEASHGASGSSALPDFLSDGPMQCTDSNVVDNSLSASASSRTASRLISSASLTERSRMLDESSRGVSFDSSDPLRSEVDRLRREITERNRRLVNKSIKNSKCQKLEGK